MADIPRPEHPRPDLLREQWLNLNGEWEFAETDDDDKSFLRETAYPDRIVVPFCRESSLSGLGRTGFVRNVWYRRTVTLPADWRAPRTLLQIGASDWRTTVWLNGVRLGIQEGGSAPIVFEATKALRPGENTVVVHAFDDARSGIQALGKQARTPQSEGIFYTRTTGMWQTVWLEGVGSSFVKNVRIDPDVAGSRLLMSAEVDGRTEGVHLSVRCLADGKVVSESEAPADWRNGKVVLPIANPRLWSPADPFLYDLEVTLRRGDEVVDRVKTYAGLRSVSIDGHRILINGRPVFQRLVLDQGFYPDGIWTAPSDEALRKDIELAMSVGFNGARLHQKVFEPRFLYWADKLGYLVWGEFPNYGLNHRDARAERPVIEEWARVVARDRNHPSIIGWCPFNETPSEAGPLQNTVVLLTRLLDPSRPVIDTSGYIHSLPDPEVMDAHDYDQNPATFKRRWDSILGPSALPARYRSTGYGTIPFMVSEYGGIGWNVGEGWGYGQQPKTLDEFYARLNGLTSALLDNPYMFGYCYTQLTDVEQERNGVFTYDRKPKFDAARLRAIFGGEAAIEKDAPSPPREDSWRVLLGSARDGVGEWRYTFTQPADDWTAASFDDSGWSLGPGGFGAKAGFEADIRTPWTTKDIWLRRPFEWDGSPFTRVLLAIHYDNACEVRVNGAVVWESEPKAWNDAYEGFEVTDALRKALKPGRNLAAVHCHQDEGGQFVDLAILVD